MTSRSLDDLYDRVTDPNNPRIRNRVTTGLVAFDELHCGFDPSHLVTIAARGPQVATDFALHVVRHAAIDKGFPVYYAHRDRPDHADRFGDTGGAPIHFGATADDLVGALGGFARDVERHAATGLRLAVIDPFTALAPAFMTSEERTEELDEAARELQRLAQRQAITVIAVAPLKDWAGGADRFPLLRDLGVADGLTYDSDTVIIIHEAGPHRPGEVDIVAAKHRNGPEGVIAARYEPTNGQFADLGAPEAGAK